MTKEYKPLRWLGSAYKDLKSSPAKVQKDIGFALQFAQRGSVSPKAKPLKGFAGAGVVEVIEDYDGDTYRAVYTVRFKDVVFVLHVFKKKSKKGIATPKQEIELIKSRLKEAEYRHKNNRY